MPSSWIVASTCLIARKAVVGVTRTVPLEATTKSSWNSSRSGTSISTENALTRLPFKGAYNFRPGLMSPKPGQKHLKTLYRAGLVLVPVLKLFLPLLTLEQVGRAMLYCAEHGAPKNVLEVPDIAALAAT